MSLQQYMSFLHKPQNVLLLNLGKNFAAGFIPSKGFGHRVFRKGTVLSGTRQSNLQNKRGSGSHQREDGTEISGQEFDAGETSQVKIQEKATDGSPALVVKKKWKKINSSVAAQKYFQNSFLDKYPSLVQDGNKSRHVQTDDFGSLGTYNTLNDHKEGRHFRDERDPNERLSEILPEDVDETRDRRLNIPLTRDGRIGKNAYYYTRKMSIFGRQGKIKEALSVFEHWMMLRDRVMPNKRTFNVLIGILGRVGYTDKAFELYQKMRNLGLDPEDQVYTGLFNACANSPWPRQSLKQAENLLSSLQSKGIQLNLITLKAAAKAMAFCGNFPRAFTIMDEASTYVSLDAESFDHLLMACVADKQKGFCRALQVWQKMQEFNVQPETSTYNMLIRSVRDCGIGDPDDFAKVLGLIDGKSKLFGQIDSLKLDHSKQLEVENRPHLTLTAGNIVHSAADSASLNTNTRLLSLDNTDVDTKEHNSPKQERHNLFHNVPNFDRDMEEFLMQRDAEREKFGSADMYEWWEEQPTDVRQQLDKQLCHDGWLDWTNREGNQATSEGELEALTLGGYKDNSIVPESVCLEIATDSENSTSETEQQLSILPEGVQKISKMSLSLSQVEEDKKPLIVKNITTPALRLEMLGGARKLVLHMSNNGATPDVKTFSQLVPCLPSTEQAEDDLLQLMQELGVVPDVDLINDLMLKRNMRHNGNSAKALLPVMSKFGLVPNMRTYSALALTCLKENEAHNLLRDMKAANLEPNSEVMGHFIYISRANFSYKLHMLQKMEWMGLSPKPATISAIEKSIAITKKKIIQAEAKKDIGSHYLSTEYQESFRRFLNFYKTWLQRNTLHKSHHPWSSFQRNNIDEEEQKNEIKKEAT